MGMDAGHGQLKAGGEYGGGVEMIAFAVGVVLLVVGLAVSIALHELGHLWPAKKFGVRVGQYMIGFGPTLWSRRRGETQYGVKAIPLGGYISMAGMYPPSPREAEAAHRTGRAGGGFFATMVQDARAANDETLLSEDDDRVFYKLPVWQRIVIMLGGPVMNLLFAIVLFAILLSGIGVQTATTTIQSVSECVIPTDADRTECAPDDPVAPAASAGLEPGDVIVSVDGTGVETFAEASAIIRRSPGDQLIVVVQRDGVVHSVTLTPMAITQPVTDELGKPVLDEDGTPQTEEVGFAGIRQEVDYLRQPIWAGPQMAVENVGAVAGIIWQLPVKIWDAGASLVTGEERDPNGPLSVVGAGVLAGEVAAADAPVLNRVAGLLSLLASLNIALFVFNMIPLLPLDGGHIAVALWEGLKRAWAKIAGRPAPKPVDATKLVPVTFVVVIALIVMGGVLILADIFNPVSLF
jgi:membrane-associated protease RseP (regulator of RpoE activity)